MYSSTQKVAPVVVTTHACIHQHRRSCCCYTYTYTYRQFFILLFYSVPSARFRHVSPGRVPPPPPFFPPNCLDSWFMYPSKRRLRCFFFFFFFFCFELCFGGTMYQTNIFSIYPPFFFFPTRGHMTNIATTSCPSWKTSSTDPDPDPEADAWWFSTPGCKGATRPGGKLDR